MPGAFTHTKVHPLCSTVVTPPAAGCRREISPKLALGVDYLQVRSYAHMQGDAAVLLQRTRKVSCLKGM